MSDELYAFETELWARADDPAFYSERLTEDAVLVFPAPTDWRLPLHRRTPIDERPT